jgi:hypothetical protein
MIIPKGQALIAFIVSVAVMLGGTHLAVIQLAQAQTVPCVVADKAEPANLGITVNYIPNVGAFPAETFVEIQRRLNGGAWAQIPPTEKIPGGTRSWIDNSIVQGAVDNKYEYRARVLNDDGPSGWSPIGCKTIKRELRVPPTPTLVVS